METHTHMNTQTHTHTRSARTGVCQLESFVRGLEIWILYTDIRTVLSPARDLPTWLHIKEGIFYQHRHLGERGERGGKRGKRERERETGNAFLPLWAQYRVQTLNCPFRNVKVFEGEKSKWDYFTLVENFVPMFIDVLWIFNLQLYERTIRSNQE